MILLLAVAAPASARGERGAWTLELSGGGGLFRGQVIQEGVIDAPSFALGPTGRLSVFHALSHELEAGVSVLGQGAQQRSFPGVDLDGRAGTYVEKLSTGAVFGLLRLVGLGLISRVFLELGPGLRVFRRGGRALLQPPSSPGGDFLTYGLDLPAHNTLLPALGLAVGWVWVGDRLTLGLRVGGDLTRHLGAISPGLQLQLLTSWSLYP